MMVDLVVCDKGESIFYNEQEDCWYDGVRLASWSMEDRIAKEVLSILMRGQDFVKLDKNDDAAALLAMADDDIEFRKKCGTLM